MRHWIAWPFRLHVALRRRAGRLGDGGALGEQDLGAHDVDAGHLFGDGMLDLDAGVDLDEIEGAAVAIHQELDRAGAFIVGVFADFQPEAADLVALRLGQIGRRRALDDLLVAALHRTVALPQVVEPAVFVAEDLHLDMAGVQDHLLEEALAVAEGVDRLAPAFEHLFLELVGAP